MAIPALTTVRVQLFFSDKRMEWSEVYYAPPGTAIDAALAEATDTLGPLRAKCLGRNVAFQEIRASVDNVFRDSLVVEPGLKPVVVGEDFAYSKGIIACGPAAAPTRCLRLREEATSLHRRISYFSGMPDSVVTDQGNWSFGASDCAVFDNNFQSYLDYLNAAGTFWGFISFVKPPTVVRNVLTAGRSTDLCSVVNFTFDGVANTPFAIGSTVQLSRMGDFPGNLRTNGKYDVVGTPAANIVGLRLPACGPVSVFNGQISLVTRAFNKITKVIPDGWAIHKRGAAELAPRGRSRSRRLFAV